MLSFFYTVMQDAAHCIFLHHYALSTGHTLAAINAQKKVSE